MKVDYSFYVENFGGSQVPERAWLSLELKAEKRLEYFSFGRTGTAGDWSEQDWEQDAKYAICEMAEAMQKREARGNIASENNDGYSVSYQTEQTEEEFESRLYQIASTYLMSSGLLYMGVDEE
mgnify:CR=1 FL=1